MSENQNEALEKARQEIEKLQSENSDLIEQMMSFTGLAGQMHRHVPGSSRSNPC